ncbi:hypothetical protein MNBD_NITROSPIRAE03-889 [hydrothermal vent metagenome]|uniref:Uncharacterized protein n=1 Tax=hydrothermal vent metagenome TaxID=652676 RepID=A0A3B1D4K6_9ZZZZ
MFFIVCLPGSSINIPVHREEVEDSMPVDDVSASLHTFMGIKVPRTAERVIAVNPGGAILPGLLSLYLLRQVPFTVTFVATAITSLVAYLLSKPVKGVGVGMPAFVPPVISASVGNPDCRRLCPPGGVYLRCNGYTDRCRPPEASSNTEVEVLFFKYWRGRGF